MTAIMRQIEETEQKEKTVKAGPCSTQIEGGVGNVDEKVGEKRRFREAGDAVRARQQDKGCAVREVGREARSLKTRNRKRPGTSRVASEAKAKRRLWRRGSVPNLRKTTRPKPPKKPMLAMRGIKHVRASPNLETVQAMQWTRHLRAQPPKKQV